MDNQFFISCYFGNMPALCKIFSAGDVDFNQENDEGKTALEIVCETKHADALEYLILNGADPNYKCKDGKSVLEKMDSYCPEVQDALRDFQGGLIGAYDPESYVAKKVQETLKTRVFSQNDTQAYIREHDEKIKRIHADLLSKMSEQQAREVLVNATSAYTCAQTIRNSFETLKGKNMLKKVFGIEWTDLNSYKRYVAKIEATIKKSGLNPELVDDFIDAIALRGHLAIMKAPQAVVDDLANHVKDSLSEEYSIRGKALNKDLNAEVDKLEEKDRKDLDKQNDLYDRLIKSIKTKGVLKSKMTDLEMMGAIKHLEILDGMGGENSLSKDVEDDFSNVIASYILLVMMEEKKNDRKTRKILESKGKKMEELQDYRNAISDVVESCVLFDIHPGFIDNYLQLVKSGAKLTWQSLSSEEKKGYYAQIDEILDSIDNDEPGRN